MPTHPTRIHQRQLALPQARGGAGRSGRAIRRIVQATGLVWLTLVIGCGGAEGTRDTETEGEVGADTAGDLLTLDVADSEVDPGNSDGGVLETADSEPGPDLAEPNDLDSAGPDLAEPWDTEQSDIGPDDSDTADSTQDTADLCLPDPDAGPDIDAAADATDADADADADVHPDTDLAPDTHDTNSTSDTSDTEPGPDAAPACSPCATGRIRFERRRPNPAATALGPLEVAPLAHHPIGLIGSTLHTMTDADGTFALPLPPGATCHLTFAALMPRDPAAPFEAPMLAVLGTDHTTLPSTNSPAFLADRLWAWSTTCTPEMPIDLVIRLADGAGALSAFETARDVLTTFIDHFGPPEDDLAIVWQRSRAWSCGSCYLDARFSGVTHAPSNHHFPRAIFLSGTNANPHHFTPSIIAHELGHFALELWSSPPLIGGSHGFDRRVDPVLAWSEGAATLLGQWALIGRTTAPQRFFAVQQNVQYWVDLEAIGRSPIGDDSNLNLLVPLPRPLDPLDQPLSEGVVAAILWDLLDASAEHPGEVVALGPLLISLLSDPRLADVRAGGLDRAALGPDLVDLLDALRCDPALYEFVGPPSTLPAPLTALLLEFPYDDLPLCGAAPFEPSADQP